MVRYSIVFVAGLAAALPLNINLGAYSPALVVGDGEISFGGARAEGAAAAAAPAVQPAAATGAAQPEATAAVAANAAEADPSLTEQAQQVSALQGMGKEIAPRAEESSPVAKRDLAGFDRALVYAEAALQKGPKVQLGTGAKGSGVGIIVDNNQQAAARPGTGGAEGARAAKRAITPSNKLKVTTMYVRSGVPASFQSSSNAKAARDAMAATDAAPIPAAISVSRRDVIDAVNLNVDGSEGITMTFVEQITDEDEM